MAGRSGLFITTTIYRQILFLEWQLELSLMLNSRNVCGTRRGRGKCLSVSVFPPHIFSHLFFPSYIQTLCNTDVGTVLIRALNVCTVHCIQSPYTAEAECTETAVRVCFGNKIISPYIMSVMAIRKEISQSIFRFSTNNSILYGCHG